MSFQIRYIVDQDNNSNVSFISNYELALFLTEHLADPINLYGTVSNEVTFELNLPGVATDPDAPVNITQTLTGQQIGTVTFDGDEYKIVELTLDNGGN